MAYIDGFVLAVPTDKREQFIKHCEILDSWFIEHGATRVVETWGDNVPKGEVTDYYRATAASEDETVCFSWVEWPDKQTRDTAMAEVENNGFEGDDRFDPEKNPVPFDGKRVIIGSFDTVFESTAE